MRSFCSDPWRIVPCQSWIMPGFKRKKKLNDGCQHYWVLVWCGEVCELQQQMQQQLNPLTERYFEGLKNVKKEIIDHFHLFFPVLLKKKREWLYSIILKSPSIISKVAVHFLHLIINFCCHDDSRGLFTKIPDFLKPERCVLEVCRPQSLRHIGQMESILNTTVRMQHKHIKQRPFCDPDTTIFCYCSLVSVERMRPTQLIVSPRTGDSNWFSSVVTKKGGKIGCRI